MSTNYSKIIEALEEDNARLAAEVKRLRGALQNIIDECSWGGRKGKRTNDMLDRGRAALSAAPAPQPITNLDSIGNELVAMERAWQTLFSALVKARAALAALKKEDKP